MDKDNLPSDRVGATNVLIGMKSSLIELVEMLSVGGIKTDMEIDSWAWSEIEKIDNILEGNDE